MSLQQSQHLQHPQRLHRITRCALAAAISFACTASAFAVTLAEQPYVGGYTRGTVDTREQLMLLDDNTFCFTFMGGSLDMRAGGRWQADGKGVRLLEVRQDNPVFPAFGKVVPEQKQNVVFDFHGYSLSNANAPVFATGADEALPTTLRPLFKPDMSSWAESYPLPPLPAAQVRYFYLGAVDIDQNRRPQRVRVVQYKRGDANLLAVGFNQVQAGPLINLVATLKEDVLQVDGERFGRRDKLPDEILEGIRAACIRPALVAGATPPPEEGSDEEAAEKAAAALGKVVVKNAALVPVKTFYLPLTAVKGAPYFTGSGK